MPEQQSQRGQVITGQNFEAPFDTAVYPYGLGGLNLKVAQDAVPVGQFTRLTNLTQVMGRWLEARPGLTSLATGGANHHSNARLNDPENSTYTRVWGIDQSVYIGQSGALTSVDSGYSGDPIYLLPHRPPLSGDPWMFVADRSRMRKIRADGLDLPIGLPAPSTEPSLSLGTRHLKTIANFNVGSDTDPAVWTPNKGYTYDDPPVQTDLPEVFGVSDCPDADDNAGINFGRIASTPLPTGSYVYWGVPVTRDLSTFGGGLDITDNDYVHLWINFSHPQHVEELRIYLVCSGSFSPTVLPGIPDGLGNNIDAYVKVIAANDFIQFFQAQASQVSAAEAARVAAARGYSLADQALTQGFAAPNQKYIRDPRNPTRGVIRNPAYTPVPPKYRRDPRNPRQVLPNTSTEVTRAQQDPARNVPVAGPAGADQWHEIGVLNVVLRRGDFQRMGETANRNWSTITGIVVMLKSGPNSGPGPIAVRMGNFYIHGGKAPDTGDPGMQPYDYRYTHYDPRTGAEGNPSPDMAGDTFIDALRRSIQVDPTAYGDSNIRQRIYRRGGSNTDDWNFVGVNSSDGGIFEDDISDDEAGGATTVNLDHYEPVPTVDDAGDEVLAQPVPVIFGPANGLIFALGDPYRPGHLYWCHPDQPDHWGAANNIEVCAPSEELMAGGMYGPQPFCFSRERLYLIYPNLSGATAVQATTSGCTRGLVSRWGWTVGLGGIYGVASDGIFNTTGGQEEVISDEIQKLFRGETWNGYPPIDFDFPTAFRLAIWRDVLYFQYQATDGNRYVATCQLLYNKAWAIYDFAQDTSALVSEESGPESQLLVGRLTGGVTGTHDGFSDFGTAITCTVRNACWDLGRPREDKLLGDQILDADFQGVAATLQNRLNNDTVDNLVQNIDLSTGRQRFIFDSFGTVPQRARNISTEISWSSASARPKLYFLGQSVIPEPDQTINRVTQWDDFGHPDESYFTGVTFDCDTGGEDRTIIIERDFAGLTSTVATLTVNTNGRHKVKFTWTAVPAHKWRIRPNDDCVAWILYKADPIAKPEPPRVAGWDIHFEADGDQYYTGLDLFCDTDGAEKQIQVSVDGAVLTNPYTGEAFWRITTVGRQWKHLTFLAGRGHVFHFVALDPNPGLLYSHKWFLDPEPSEQSNWNQNYSVHGTLADKWFKGFLFEVDTFGQSKQVTIDIDGTVVETLSVNTNGRKVVHLTLTTQRLGRVLRVYPTDGNPSRPYTIVPIFDVEPYKLNQWETQETDHDLQGFQVPLEAQITLRSTAPVILTLAVYVNQLGTIVATTYTIPSTNGVKDKRFVPFQAVKGVLCKYHFSSTADFHLFEEESQVAIWPWGADQVLTAHPFGNDDQDRTRNMVLASAAAARSGGGT